MRIDVIDERNNCIILRDGTTVTILNFAVSKGVIYVIGKPFLNQRPLFTLLGFSSELLSINIVKETNTIQDWPCNLILAKAFKIQSTLRFKIFPILHTFASCQ